MATLLSDLADFTTACATIPPLVTARFTGPWRRRDFLLFWSGQSVSIFGAPITKVALSFTAVLVLNATAFEIGMLRVAGIGALAAALWVARSPLAPLRHRPAPTT